jgi:ABC-type oligopeptide transport system substrate-binding subunit
MKTKNVTLVALSLFAALSGMAGCSGTSSASSSSQSSVGGGSSPSSSAAATIPDTFTACLASEPGHVDPALNSAVDGASLDVHLFGGLYRYVNRGDGTAKLAPDLAVAAPTMVKNADGSVSYTFTLRDGITFSDGTPIVASDFVKSWKRAGGVDLGADYGYMFDILTRDTDGNVKGVEAKDDKTLVVTCPVEVPYFLEIMAFPAFLVIKNADTVDKLGTWAMDPGFATSGAYTITKWVHDGSITMSKNPKYWDAADVTVPTLKFALSDDTTAMLTNYETNSYQMIDDVPLTELDNLKKRDDFHLNGQLGTYYVCFNMDSPVFTKANTEEKRESVRKGLSLLIDRNNIVDNVSKGGEMPANSFVPIGLTDADGATQFIAKNGVNGDGKGYYSVAPADYNSNVAAGINLIKAGGYTYDDTAKKFTDFPALTYIYNTNDTHKAVATAIQTDFAAVGITTNLQNSEWNTFLDTRKHGDFDIARNGWLADFNDPITFLDMWTTDSGNNDCQFGKVDSMGHDVGLTTYAGYSLDINNDGTISNAEKNLTWAQSYDVGITAVKNSEDPVFRFAMLHNLETLLMSTGGIAPIYYYTDIYMLKSNVQNFFYSPLGYKFFLDVKITA